MYITEWAHLLLGAKGRSPQGPNSPVTLRPDISKKGAVHMLGNPHIAPEERWKHKSRDLSALATTHPLCCIKADGSPSSREPSLTFALGCHLASTLTACFGGHTFCLLPAAGPGAGQHSLCSHQANLSVLRPTLACEAHQWGSVVMAKGEQRLLSSHSGVSLLSQSKTLPDAGLPLPSTNWESHQLTHPLPLQPTHAWPLIIA